MVLGLEKIFEHLEKIDISYKISKEKENFDSNSEYPYKTIWIDYIKTTQRFFKKLEGLNEKGFLESTFNSKVKVTDHKIITNEIAIILEENNFVESLILIIVKKNFKPF